MKKALSIICSIILSLVFFVVGVLFAVRIVDGVAFFPFYLKANPVYMAIGVTENYVSQGYDYDADKGVFLATGYMSDDTASRVYVIEENGDRYYTSLKKANGDDYTGHTGGITHYGDYVYITGSKGLDVFSYNDIFDKNTDSARCLGTVLTYNDPAHCYVANGYILAGSFFIESDYETADYERVTTPAGDQNTSIITAFKLDDSKEFCVDPAPKAVISTTRCVQGMCVTDDGKVILSTSYGLSVSKLYVYDTTNLVGEDYDFVGTAKSGAFAFNGIKRYYLDSSNLVDTISAPPMAEELVYLDGKIYIMNESACNKYIFGKFTSGYKIYAYPYV